jgi:hypothetical protein
VPGIPVSGQVYFPTDDLFPELEGQDEVPVLIPGAETLGTVEKLAHLGAADDEEIDKLTLHPNDQGVIQRGFIRALQLFHRNTELGAIAIPFLVGVTLSRLDLSPSHLFPSVVEGESVRPGIDRRDGGVTLAEE